MEYNINLHGLEQSLSTDYVENILKKKFKKADKLLRVQEDVKIDLYKENKKPQYKMTINCIGKDGSEYNFKERGDDLRNLIDEVCDKANETIFQGNSKRKDKKINMAKKFCNSKRKHKDID